MLANKNIFCNSPWYEIHIYWDGSLGICCQEDHKLYRNNDQYNIATMSIAEWFNSDPVSQFRNKLLGAQRLSECRRCYTSEDNNGISRRIRNNQKSVIFTRTAFEPSFQQSPGYRHFEHSHANQGTTTNLPIDMHIDLGNFCNLACKMCNAQASSQIAVQEVRWGIESSKKFVGSNWTANDSVWENFKLQLLEIKSLNNIHFMGGETLLTDRFDDLVSFMVDHQRFDLCFSFVTNGTVYKPKLIEKLKLFRRVGIEVSIEAVDDHNAYQRQGTDTAEVLANIEKYQEHCNGTNITVSLRPAPSLLSIGYYPGLLKYALDKKLIVKSNLCSKPDFLYAVILPQSVKQHYQQAYIDLLSQLDNIGDLDDYNASDPNNYQKVVKEEALMCLTLLQTPAPANAEKLLEQLVAHCRRWDDIYGYNARELYPELTEVWDRYGY